MPKNVQTSVLISHASKVMLKILQVRIQQYVNQELPDVQDGLKKKRNQRLNCQHLLYHRISREILKKTHIYFCFTEYAKAFACVNHNKLWKILKEMENPDHLTCLLRNLCAGQEAAVRIRHGITDWFSIGKEYIKAAYGHPYLTSMQSTSYEIPGWMTHKLESRFLGEISTISDMQMIPL